MKRFKVHCISFLLCGALALMGGFSVRLAFSFEKQGRFQLVAQRKFSIDEVKTAFLLNFGRFVDWPAAALSKTPEQFNICLLGPSGLGEEFALKLETEKVKDRKVKITQIPPASIESNCQILYIGTGSSELISNALEHFKTSPTLTVGDAPDFVSRGGIIQFVVEENHLRFEVNMNATQRAGLTISSKLLRVAKVVK
jgi:hypothetical protein